MFTVVSTCRSLTNTLVRTAIEAGADILTVHGRTRHQSSSGHPVNLESLAFAVSCAKGDVPVIANGDVFTLEDAEETRRRCNVRGVMSARGLLANPVRSLTSRPSLALKLTLPCTTGTLCRLRQDSTSSYFCTSLLCHSRSSHADLCVAGPPVSRSLHESQPQSVSSTPSFIGIWPTCSRVISLDGGIVPTSTRSTAMPPCLTTWRMSWR